MSAARPVFRRLLVPVDFSAPSEEAWLTARRLARVIGSELVLVHVFVEGPFFSEGPFTVSHVREVYESSRVWVDKMLEQWATEARAEGLSVRTLVRTGVPYREIVATAVDERADLIVMGTHGRGGVDRVLLGSVADRVIRQAPCPVLAVREPA